MILQKLYELNLVNTPYWLPTNTQMLVLMGSQAYGVETKDSDFDVYGFCIPNKEVVFPQEFGYIAGYDDIPTFEQWSQHGITHNLKNYDFAVYGITKYFKLLTNNNPNIIDSLFVPQSCVMHCTKLAQMIRDNRHCFLHKGLYKQFRGYSIAQKNKVINKNSTGKRKVNRENGEFDLKFSYHLVRLLSECEQLLSECDLDLQETSRKAYLKSIRDGHEPLESVMSYFDIKEKQLEKLYETTKLPEQPDLPKIRSLLINCLEQHYGRIQNLHINVSDQAIKEIKQILVRNNL